MKKFKKIFTSILVVLLISITLTACSSKKETNTANSSTSGKIQIN